VDFGVAQGWLQARLPNMEWPPMLLVSRAPTSALDARGAWGLTSLQHRNPLCLHGLTAFATLFGSLLHIVAWRAASCSPLAAIYQVFARFHPSRSDAINHVFRVRVHDRHKYPR
jgi:hypothetical protein